MDKIPGFKVRVLLRSLEVSGVTAPSVGVFLVVK
jgi:hypothetical protein